MTGGGSRLSFVVPVYEEADGVARTWEALVAAGDRMTASGLVAGWEAVLVDDGSGDGTADLLAGWAADDHRLVVATHDRNRGLGAALRTGLATATGDVVLYTDADLPFELAEVERVLAPVLAGELDLVAGRRIGRRREGLGRAVQSVVYNALVRVLFGLPLGDVNFACKAANRIAWPDAIASDSGFVDVEWLLQARTAGARLGEVRVEFHPRRWGRSTLGGPANVPGLLRDLARVRRADRERQRGFGAVPGRG